MQFPIDWTPNGKAVKASGLRREKPTTENLGFKNFFDSFMPQNNVIYSEILHTQFLSAIIF